MPFLTRSLAGLSLLLLSHALHAADCDASAGEKIFQTKCSACHALDSERVGPHLAGVVGRPIGAVPGFAYSADLAAASSSNWSLEQLDRWLTAPAKMFPETAMAFGGLRNPGERQAVLCFLTQHG
ncbi:c-type cytochrome [Pseudomonas sp. UL073]|uniref:C-type cytochrome n=1 Tax=Zestomonas insulae TaxID=2809017 RepID=A0ABS2ICA8_9GAMM|nr:c-type cytochrome [Pseudomonas insulae]MBM7060298.1 c-type cytochrome [Pseudomonas insulae]